MKSVASVIGSDSSYRLFDDMPISVMLCELDNFKITYINESTRENLKKIEHVLPVKVDALIGQSIDIFHKNPQHHAPAAVRPEEPAAQGAHHHRRRDARSHRDGHDQFARPLHRPDADLGARDREGAA
ncbi:hypothetical protein [Bradyrhizobium elkanii]|uniref:hypothetical protein n=1 Tax=Bradyrhizobium elkanii TaxID=29448 RepID=UPI0033976BCE